MGALTGEMTEASSRGRMYVYALLGASVVLYPVTRLIGLRAQPVFVDEATYVYWAQSLMKTHRLVSMSHGKPPLHTLLLGPWLKLFGDPLLATRTLSVLFGALTLTCVILLGRELLDLRLGAWCGLLWVLCPYPLFWERYGLAESMLMFFFVLGVLFAVMAVMRANHWYLAGAGICTGLALLTKQTAILMFLVIPFAYLARGPRQRGRERSKPLARWLVSVVLSLGLAYGISSLLRLSPNYTSMVTAQNELGWTKTLSELVSNPFDLVPGNIKVIATSLWTWVTPVMLLLCVVGLLLAVIRKWRPAYFMVAWIFVCFTVCAMVARNASSRYWLVMLPPLIVGGAYAIVVVPSLAWRRIGALEKGGHRTAWVVILVSLLVAFVAGFSAVIGISYSRSVYNPSIKTHTRWSNGWGFREIVDSIDARRATGERLDVYVFDHFAGRTLSIYFPDDERVRIIRYTAQSRTGVTGAMRKSRSDGRLVYVVYGPGPLGIERLQGNWPVAEEERYPPGADDRVARTLARLSIPWISEVRPGRGSPGARISIKGFDFGSEQKNSSVLVGGRPATGYGSWSDNAILAVVPDCPAGLTTVVVKTAMGSSNPRSFRVK